jgi:hypothetical protein
MMIPCVDLTEASVKIFSATGGFLGGTSMMLYMRPSGMLDAIRRCIVSVLSSSMLTVPVAEKIFDEVGAEVVMGTAFAIGFVAWSMLGAIAKFFENRQGQDIVQLAKSVKPENE